MHQPLPSAGATMARSRAPTDGRRAASDVTRRGKRSRHGPRPASPDRGVARVDAGRARYPARTMTTLLDLLDASVTRYGDRRRARRCGSTTARRPRWSYRELARRSRIAAWRLRALGPRARRPDPDVVAVHARAAGRLLRGDGRAARARAARPADVAGRGRGHRHGVRAHATSSSAPAATPRTRARRGWTSFPTTTVEALCAEPAADDPAFPPDWEARQAAWATPGRAGGLRAHLHLGHDRDAEGRDARPTTTSSPRSSRSTGSSRRWSTGSCRCCRSRTCSSRRSGSTTRSTSGPTSCTSAAGTRGSSSTRCATSA